MTLDEALASIPKVWTAWELRSRSGRTRFVYDLSRELYGSEVYVLGHGSTPVEAVLQAITKAAKESHD